MKKILFKIFAVVFALSVIGNLFGEKIFIEGIILTAIFAYFGWKPNAIDTSTKK